jgi:hypothetical protein
LVKDENAEDKAVEGDVEDSHEKNKENREPREKRDYYNKNYNNQKNYKDKNYYKKNNRDYGEQNQKTEPAKPKPLPDGVVKIDKGKGLKDLIG